MSIEIARLLKRNSDNMTVVDWIWPGYLARGHLHILAGSPGCGKTQIALNLAAIIGQEGRAFPCGMLNPEAASTVMWSGEDSITDTLIPRLVAAQYNPEHFYHVEGVTNAERETITFNPAIHLEALRLALSLTDNVKLLIIDPIVSMITGEGNSNAQVRSNLAPLVKLAQELNIAILGIHHFSKGTQDKPLAERVNGSLAMTALARIVMIAGEDVREDAPTTHVFGKAKANITTSGEGFGYNIKPVMVANTKFSIETTVTSWKQELDVTLGEALGNTQSKNQIAPSLSKIQQAADLILDTLKKEPMSWFFLSSLCAENKIGSRTARTARDRLRSGGVIEIEYGNQWQQAPKWALKHTVGRPEEEPMTLRNSDNTATSDDLLNNGVSHSKNNIVNTEGTVGRKAECHEGAIYSAKSSKSLVFNEGFESYDTNSPEEGGTIQ
jgi:putative DNA primase/helicase